MITPAITIVSAVEGSIIVNPRIPVVPIALIIIAVLFFIQKFGTKVVGRSFGPIMLVWILLFNPLSSGVHPVRCGFPLYDRSGYIIF
ncbi:MAG: KUP/HAK/KT family potassium transporter [Bacteroidales bacterium]|nr:KUP/HAK/KT family potassium transporter [Bacteroidales bacterium]